MFLRALTIMASLIFATNTLAAETFHDKATTSFDNAKPISFADVRKFKKFEAISCVHSDTPTELCPMTKLLLSMELDPVLGEFADLDVLVTHDEKWVAHQRALIIDDAGELSWYGQSSSVIARKSGVPGSQVLIIRITHGTLTNYCWGQETN